MGPYKPLRNWVDDHPLLYGNNGSLDPGSYLDILTGFLRYIPKTFLEVCKKLWFGFILNHQWVLVLCVFLNSQHLTQKTEDPGVVGMEWRASSGWNPKCQAAETMHHVSNEKNTGRFGYIGDEILPSYIGIIVNHEIRIPIKQPILWKVRGFFSWLIFFTLEITRTRWAPYQF